MASQQVEKRLAVLTLDGRRLLLPQRQVQSLEPLLDLVRDSGIANAVGMIAFAGYWWPVYCLSGNLDVLSDIPPTRRVVTLLSDGEHLLALLCDQVEALDEEQPRLYPLPACMAGAVPALQALTLQQGELGCVTDTARLVAFLAQASGRESVDARPLE